MEKAKLSTMAAALGIMAANAVPGYGDDIFAPRRARKPKDKTFTAFDHERLDRAAAKRERKARVKMCLWADAEARKLKDIEWD